MIYLLPLIACWPVWLWSLERMQDRSDDPFGALALLVAVGFSLLTMRSKRATPLDGKQCALVCISLIAYAVTAGMLPMLMRSMLAMTAIALLLSWVCFGKRVNLAILGLCLLALPVVATMQFYLGYPLRMLVTHSCVSLLSLAGYVVRCSGTDLICGNQVIGIDPACSGIRMLWTGLFVGFTLAALRRISAVKTCTLCAATIVIVIAGNLMRASMLFFLEIIKHNASLSPPEWIHSGIGVCVFSFILLAVTGLATLLSNKTSENELVARELNPERKASSTRTQLALTASCLLALMAPHLVPRQALAAGSTKASIQLPATFEGIPVKQVPLNEQELKFSRAFPGEIHKFTDGRRQFILRVVLQPTRQLHPSEDCFKGMGYVTKTLPNQHVGGVAWGHFEAVQGSTRLDVRERIYDRDRNSWTDVSGWYWSAVLGKSHGPWQALTIAERCPERR